MVSSRLLAIVLWSIQLRPQIAAFHTVPLGLRCVSGGNTFTCPSNNPRSSWASAWAARQRLGGRFQQPTPRMMAAAGGGGEDGDSRIQLPIIDLSPMMREGGGTAAELEAIGAQVRQACMTDGIFYVSGHGVEEGKLNGALQASKSFFSLPQQDKELVTCQPGRGTGFTRGYIEMGGESGSDRLEVKEAFSFGYEWPEGASRESWTNSLQGPNSWPPETGVLDPEEWKRASQKNGGGATWKKTLNSFYSENVRVCELITSTLSLALGMNEGELLGYCRADPSRGMSGGETISLMRLFHYLPYAAADEFDKVQGGPENQERIGSSPHTDWGFLTLILQDPSVIGLQMYKNGRWLDVPPVPGTFVCNIGDYVSLLTGGTFKSPLHRVVTADRERYSFVFFYYPSHEAQVPALDAATQDTAGLSLLSDQNSRGSGGSQAVHAAPCAQVSPGGSFGDFIASKWAQVQRK